jgi:hypothetical protein
MPNENEIIEKERTDEVVPEDDEELLTRDPLQVLDDEHRDAYQAIKHAVVGTDLAKEFVDRAVQEGLNERV